MCSGVGMSDMWWEISRVVNKGVMDILNKSSVISMPKCRIGEMC